MTDWMTKDAEAKVIRATMSSGSDDMVVAEHKIAIKIRATEATKAEAIRNNLAQSIFKAVGILQYDGNITIAGRQIGTKYEQFWVNVDSGRTK
jgi:hypothetical protein